MSQYAIAKSKKTPRLRIIPVEEAVIQPPRSLTHMNNITITDSSLEEITNYYDTVLNVDKTTYVSSNDEPTPMDCVKEMLESIPDEF